MKKQFNGIRHVLGVSKIPSKGTKMLLPKYLADKETLAGPVNTLPVVSQVHQAGSTQGHCLNSFTLVNRNYASSQITQVSTPSTQQHSKLKLYLKTYGDSR
jgi:hypothetical protein